MRFDCAPLAAALLLAPGLGGCISSATYDHDMAAVRAEAQASRQASEAQVTALIGALASAQRTLEAEITLRAAELRARAQPPVAGASGDHAELRQLREQAQANALQIQRLEATLRQLSTRKAGRAVELDNASPWGLLNAPQGLP